jgi:hypothetical protein
MVAAHRRIPQTDERTPSSCEYPLMHFQNCGVWKRALAILRKSMNASAVIAGRLSLASLMLALGALKVHAD